MAVLPVPVRTICICNCCEREIVHGGQWQQSSGRRPGENPGCMDPTRECLLLSAAVPGLGWSCRGCSRSPCDRLTQPANRPVSVHLHNLCVLPHAGQALHHVPVNAAYAGRPLAASAGRQVSPEEKSCKCSM